MAQFYDDFAENMEALGLPAPRSLFANLGLVLGHVSAINAVIEKMGTRVTVGELIGAGIRSECFMVAFGMYASYYVGAVIGSAAVASYKFSFREASRIDVLQFAGRNNVRRPWVDQVVLRGHALNALMPR